MRHAVACKAAGQRAWTRSGFHQCKLPDETLHKTPLNAIDERNSILNTRFNSLTPQRRTCWACRCRNSWPEGRWSEPKSQNTDAPSRCTGKKIHHEVRNLSAGLENDGWRREWIVSPALYCRPGDPAIANHLTRHDAHNHVSRRPAASDAENRSPRACRHLSGRH